MIRKITEFFMLPVSSSIKPKLNMPITMAIFSVKS